MIHHVNTGDIDDADLTAAAHDAGLTISQFEAAAVNNAVEAYKRDVSTDLCNAAVDAGLSVTQFKTQAIDNAVETHKRREALLQALRDVIHDNADTGIVPA